MNNKEEMIQIMKSIWTSRTEEQLKSCENMLRTYSNKVGEDNIGITLIEVEIERQKLHFQIYN
tara:strand:+ start:2110 stop:2298 length:189 start_codon:yes stop_codon:yes gene_type:complete